MREIKFRAFISGDVNKMFYQGNTIDENRKIFWKKWETSCHVSDPMQFVGLKDRLGKDIYEGDIVDIDEVGRAEVIFESGCFFARWIDDPEAHMDAVGFRMKTGHKWQSTILGNIYENPELLKS